MINKNRCVYINEKVRTPVFFILIVLFQEKVNGTGKCVQFFLDKQKDF